MSQTQLPDPERISTVAERILAGREFAPASPSRDQVASGLLDSLRDLLDWAGDLHIESPTLFWIVLIGCIVALAAIMTHAGIILLRAVAASPVACQHRGDAAAKTDLSAASLLASAARLRDAGDWLGAVRMCYRAAIAALHERRLLRLESCHTPREILLALRQRPELAQHFNRMLGIYEPCVFGQARATAQQVDACTTIAAELVRHGQANR